MRENLCFLCLIAVVAKNGLHVGKMEESGLLLPSLAPSVNQLSMRML